MARKLPGNLAFDRKLARQVDAVIGVDEVGRGALAGPVVAGAVLLTGPFLRGSRIYKLAAIAGDSKQLSPQRRKKVIDLWQKEFSCLPGAVGLGTVAEVENFNVLGATRLAMERAVRGIIENYLPLEKWGVAQEILDFPGKGKDLFSQLQPLSRKTWRLLVDGRALKPFPWPHESIVKGDGKSLAIGLASILAKVRRDQMMIDLDQHCPGYGFASHKGYGSVEHREILQQKEASPYHRLSFLRKIISSDENSGPEQMAFF